MLMIAIAAIDARSFIIPNWLVLAGLALGLGEIFMSHTGPIAIAIANCGLRSLTVAGLFLGFRIGYRRLRGREGIGLGDVKLAAVAGLWLGWLAVAIATEIAALSALASVLVGVARGQKISGQTRIPFGLFFAPAIWLAWLFEAILSH